MIVNYNKNPEGYNQLFAEASEFLGIDIRDINDYYAHMEKFFTAQGYKFVMFTTEDGIVNEEPLVIDLNTRTIAVPSLVASCASVQKDQLAEMLIFEVDRFFDYMDLANTNIYVQWTTPSAEGSTKVDMMDWVSKPGKILFAWPLTEEVTATPGAVRFSVRFFRIEKVENEKHELVEKIVYSLNTQENKITIKPALQPDLSKMVVQPVNKGLFENVILDSARAAEGRAKPSVPRFGPPGNDISLLVVDDNGNYSVATLNEANNMYIANLEDNTITFCAQAYTTDLGAIEYEWCYITPNKDDNGNPIVKVYDSVSNASLVKEMYIPISQERMEALRADNAKPETNVRYYVSSGINSWSEYRPTGDHFPVPDSIDQLYERFTTFTVPGGEVEVVGDYYVAAINTKDGMSTALNPVHSSKCNLPGPQDIVIKQDLPASLILEKDEAGQLINNTLEIAIPENIYNADMTYTWNTATTEDGTYAKATGTPSVTKDQINKLEKISLDVTELGWYKVDISSKLNRKEDKEESAVCKVTYAPAAPEISNDTYDANNHLEDRFNLGVNQTQVLKVKATVDHKDDPLYNEAFEYQWYVADQGPMRPITSADSAIAEPNGNQLTVKYDANYKSARSFSCIAYNVLNGQRASSGYLTYPFIIIYT